MNGPSDPTLTPQWVTYYMPLTMRNWAAVQIQTPGGPVDFDVPGLGVGFVPVFTTRAEAVTFAGDPMAVTAFRAKKEATP